MKELKQYYRRIEKLLRGSKERTAMILNGLRADIEEYLADHPEATFADVQENFGTPEQIAESSLAQMPDTDSGDRTKQFGWKWWIAGVAGVLLLGIGVATAGGEPLGLEEEPEVVTLTWITSEEVSDEREAYINQLLLEKDYAFQVDYVSVKRDEETADVSNPDYREIRDDLLEEYPQADLIDVGMFDVEDYYLAANDISGRKLLGLDSYLLSVEGVKLENSVPELAWEAFEVDGEVYAVPIVEEVPGQMVCFWNPDLLEKYDLHPQAWWGQLWDYKEEIFRVFEGEKDNPNFAGIEGLEIFLNHIPGYSAVLSEDYPFVVYEAKPGRQAVLLYEVEEYEEMLDFLEELEEKYGFYALREREAADAEVVVLCGIRDDFTFEDEWKSQNGDLYAGYVRTDLEKRYLTREYCARGTGISRGSDNPDEAFQLLCALYTDPELVNALVWGVPGEDYQVVDDVVSGVEGDMVEPVSLGNVLACYGTEEQAKKKAESYFAAYEDSSRSKSISWFGGEAWEEELKDIYKHVMHPADETAFWWEAEVDTVAEFRKKMDYVVKGLKAYDSDVILGAWSRQN